MDERKYVKNKCPYLTAASDEIEYSHYNKHTGFSSTYVPSFMIIDKDWKNINKELEKRKKVGSPEKFNTYEYIDFQEFIDIESFFFEELFTLQEKRTFEDKLYTTIWQDSKKTIKQLKKKRGDWWPLEIMKEE